MSPVFARISQRTWKWTQFIITWRPPSPPSSLPSHSSRCPCLPDRVLIFPLPAPFLLLQVLYVLPNLFWVFPTPCRYLPPLALGKKTRGLHGHCRLSPRRGRRWCQYLCNHSCLSYALGSPGLRPGPCQHHPYITSKSWDHSTAFSSPPRFQRILKPCR